MAQKHKTCTFYEQVLYLQRHPTLKKYIFTVKRVMSNQNTSVRTYIDYFISSILSESRIIQEGLDMGLISSMGPSSIGVVGTLGGPGYSQIASIKNRISSLLTTSMQDDPLFHQILALNGFSTLAEYNIQYTTDMNNISMYQSTVLGLKAMNDLSGATVLPILYWQQQRAQIEYGTAVGVYNIYSTTQGDLSTLYISTMNAYSRATDNYWAAYIAASTLENTSTSTLASKYKDIMDTQWALTEDIFGKLWSNTATGLQVGGGITSTDLQSSLVAYSSIQLADTVSYNRNKINYYSSMISSLQNSLFDDMSNLSSYITCDYSTVVSTYCTDIMAYKDQILSCTSGDLYSKFSTLYGFSTLWMSTVYADQLASTIHANSMSTYKNYTDRINSISANIGQLSSIHTSSLASFKFWEQHFSTAQDMVRFLQLQMNEINALSLFNSTSILKDELEDMIGLLSQGANVDAYFESLRGTFAGIQTGGASMQDLQMMYSTVQVLYSRHSTLGSAAIQTRRSANLPDDIDQIYSEGFAAVLDSTNADIRAAEDIYNADSLSTIFLNQQISSQQGYLSTYIATSSISGAQVSSLYSSKYSRYQSTIQELIMQQRSTQQMIYKYTEIGLISSILMHNAYNSLEQILQRLEELGYTISQTGGAQYVDMGSFRITLDQNAANPGDIQNKVNEICTLKSSMDRTQTSITTLQNAQNNPTLPLIRDAVTVLNTDALAYYSQSFNLYKYGSTLCYHTYTNYITTLTVFSTLVTTNLLENRDEMLRLQYISAGYTAPARGLVQVVSTNMDFNSRISTISSFSNNIRQFRPDLQKFINMTTAELFSMNYYLVCKSTFEGQQYYRVQQGLSFSDMMTSYDFDQLMNAYDISIQNINRYIQYRSTVFSNFVTKTENLKGSMRDSITYSLKTGINPVFDGPMSSITSSLNMSFRMLPNRTVFPVGGVPTTTRGADCQSTTTPAPAQTTTYPAYPSTNVNTATYGIKGRYVNISKADGNFQILQVCVVDSKGRNVAFGKPVVVMNGPAAPTAAAIVNGNYSDSAAALFMYQASPGPTPVEFRIDLGADYDITSIKYTKGAPLSYNSVGLTFNLMDLAMNRVGGGSLGANTATEYIDLRTDPTATMFMIPSRMGVCGYMGRYLRISRATGASFQISQIAAVSLGGVNVALNKPVSYYSGGVAQGPSTTLVTDGTYYARPLTSSYIRTIQSATDYLQIDFGSDVELVAVHIYAISGNEDTSASLYTEDNLLAYSQTLQTNSPKGVLDFRIMNDVSLSNPLRTQCSTNLLWPSYYSVAGMMCRYIRLSKLSGELGFTKIKVVDKTGKDVTLFKEVTVSSEAIANSRFYGVSDYIGPQLRSVSYYSASNDVAPSYRVDFGAIYEICSVTVYRCSDGSSLADNMRIEFFGNDLTTPLYSRTTAPGQEIFYDTRYDPNDAGSQYPIDVLSTINTYGRFGTLAKSVEIPGYVSTLQITEGTGQDLLVGATIRHASTMTIATFPNLREVNSVILPTVPLGTRIILRDCDGNIINNKVVQNFSTTTAVYKLADFRNPTIPMLLSYAPMAPLTLTPLSSDTTGLYTIANGVSTRYVRVTPPPGAKLYLSQILVIDSRGINVAFQKDTFTTDAASISATSKAVDGKYEQSLDSGVPSVLSYDNYVLKSESNSFVTTVADKYWIVDLGKEYSVNSIIFVAATGRGYDSRNVIIELFNAQLNRVGVQLVSKYVSVFGVDILDFRMNRVRAAHTEGNYMEVRPRKITAGCTGCGIMTQYVRIEGTDINLSQIIAMDPNGTNIALYMPTYSPTNVRNSYKVVDGKYYRKLETALTGESEAFIAYSPHNNYVEVNFGAEFEVVNVFLVPTVEHSTITGLKIKLYNEFRDVIALLDPSLQNSDYSNIPISLTGANNIVFPSATNVIGVSILRKYSEFLTQAGQMSATVATADPVLPLGFSCPPGQVSLATTSCASVPLLITPRFTRGSNGGIPCRYIRVYNVSQYVQISQIMAYGADGTNYAYQKGATSESIFPGTYPAKVTDGLGGYFHNARTWAESYRSSGKRYDFLEIDLTTTSEIVGVRCIFPSDNEEQNVATRIILFNEFRVSLAQYIVGGGQNPYNSGKYEFQETLVDYRIQPVAVPINKIIMPKIYTLGGGTESPNGIVEFGTDVYVADTLTNKIIKNGATFSSDSLISYPAGLARDMASIYVASYGNNKVLRIATTGTPTVTQLCTVTKPYGVYVNLQENRIYVTSYTASPSNYYSVEISTGNILATVSLPSVNFPNSIVHITLPGQATPFLLICSANDKCIYRVNTGATATTTPYIGTAGSTATIQIGMIAPSAITYDSNSHTLFISDYVQATVYYAKLVTGETGVIAGNGTGGYGGDGGQGVLANMDGPMNVTYSASSGRLYVSDYKNKVVRYLNLYSQPAQGVASTTTTPNWSEWTTTTLSAAAVTTTPLDTPQYSLTPATPSTLSQIVTPAQISLVMMNVSAMTAIYVTNDTVYYAVGGSVFVQGTAAAIATGMGYIMHITMNGGSLYVCDIINRCIWKQTATGFIKYIGPGATYPYTLHNPVCIGFDKNNQLYISDSTLRTVIRLNSRNVLENYVGGGVALYSPNVYGSQFDLSAPQNFVFDSRNNLILIAGETVYKVLSANGTIQPICNYTGGATTYVDQIITESALPLPSAFAYKIRGPYGITIDAADTLYVTSMGGQQILKLTPDLYNINSSTYSLDIVAGFGSLLNNLFGNAASVDSLAKYASLNHPAHIYYQPSGIYFLDMTAYKVRKITPAVTSSVAYTEIVPYGNMNIVANYSKGSFNDMVREESVETRAAAGVAIDSSGNIYVANTAGHQILMVTPLGVVSVLAGEGTAGWADGTGTAAKFNQPQGLALGTSGTILYVADTGNNRIRAITISTGATTTLAGEGTAAFLDGAGAAAKFNGPRGVAIGSSGTILYVADTANYRIRAITISSGATTTLAGDGTAAFLDGTGAAAKFNGPRGVAVGPSGTTLYVADTANHRIRAITISTGATTTLAGAGTAFFEDGTGTAVKFNSPRGIVVASDGTIYVGDTGNNRIRRVTSAGVTTTVAGQGDPALQDGMGIGAKFNQPGGLALNPLGLIYVADIANNCIRIVNVTGVVTTLPKYNIGFNALGGKFTATSICVDSANNLYFPNSITRQICKMSSNGNLTSWPATLNTVGMAIYKDTTLYITDGTRITPMSIAGGSLGTPIALAGCSCIAISPLGYMYVSASTSVFVYNLKRIHSTVITMQISRPETYVVSSIDCLGVDPDCNLYVGITSGMEFRICKYDSGRNLKAATVNLSSKVTGLVFSKGSLYYLRNYSIFQTNGTENAAALHSNGNLIFNSSLFTGISVIGKGIQGQVCDAAYGNTTTLNKPVAITADINGAMYIVDEAVKSPGLTQVTSIIIKSTSYIPLQSGLLYNIAGTNAPGTTTPNLSAHLENFSSIKGVCYDSVGNMYVADSALNTVSKIDLTGKLTTFAGQINTVGGYTGDGGAAATARLRGPTDIKMSKSDVLYIADTGNNAIRRVKLVGGTNYNIETFISNVTSPTALTIDYYENIYVVTGASVISVISPLTGALTNVVNAGFNVNALAVNTTNQLFYTGNGRINRVGGTPISGFTQPTGIVIDDSNTIYVSDVAANKVFSISGGTNTAIIGNGLQETPVSITEGLAENIYGNGAPPLFRAFSAPGALSIKPSRGGLLVAQPTKISLLSGATTNLRCGTQANSFTISNTGTLQIFLSQVVALDTTGTNVLLKSAAQSYFDGFYGCKSNAKAHVIGAGQNLQIALPANTTITCILLYFGVSYKTGWNGARLQFGDSYTRYIQGVTDSPGSQYALFDYRTKTPACIPFINYVNKYKLQTTASHTTETYRVQYVRYVRITSLTTQMTVRRIYAIHGETGEDLLFGKVPYLNAAIKAICLAGDITNIAKATTIGATQVFPSSNGGGITNFWIEYDFGDEYPVEQIIIHQLVSNTGKYSVSFYTSNRAEIVYANLLDSQIQTIQMDSGVTISPTPTAANIQSGSPFTITGFTVPTGLVPHKMLRLQNSAQQEIGRVGLTYTAYKYSPPALPPYLAYSLTPVAGTQRVRYIRVSGLIQLSQILVLDSNCMNVSYGKTATSSVASTNLNSPMNGSDGVAFSAPAIVTTHASSFNGPFGLAFDSAGSIFVTDYSNNLIRKVTSGGTVSTLAGSGTAGSTDGTEATASFNGPTGVTVDSTGNIIITEYVNNSLRRISTAVATYGQVTTLGSFTGACGVAIDSAGNIYVSETGNHRIIKRMPTGTITTLAGSGSVGSTDDTGSAASFNYPNGIAIDSAGNIFVADYSNNRIRKVTSAGVVSTLAGNGAAAFADGPATNASFNGPKGVAVDSAGNVYVADFGNNRIRIITTLNGVTTVGTLAGDGAAASFSGPSGVAVDSAGNIFVADTNNNRIIKITIPNIWWELDLGQEHDIIQIVCINKTSSANNATIELMNAFRERQGSTLNLNGAAEYTSFDLYSTAKSVVSPVSDIISAQNFYTPDTSLQRIVRGRYVRIENASPGSPFSPTVTGIYDIYGKNLMVARSVSVSSPLPPSQAYPPPPLSNYGAWWEVDLGQEYSIKDILYTGTTVGAAIYNRMRAEIWRNFISGSLTVPFPLQIDPATTTGMTIRFIRLVGACIINHVAAIDVNGIDVAVWKPVRIVSGATVTFTAFNGLYASAIELTSGTNNRLEIDLGRNMNISAIRMHLWRYNGSATCTAFNSSGIPMTLPAGFSTIDWWNSDIITPALQNYTLTGFKTRYVGITTAAPGATVNNIVVLDTLGRNIIPNSAKDTNGDAVYGFTNTFSSAITLPTLYTELDLGEEHYIVSVIVYYNMANIVGLNTIAVKLMDAYYTTVVSTVSPTKLVTGDYGKINYNLGQPWDNRNNLLTVPAGTWTPTTTECSVNIHDIAIDSSNNIYALLSNRVIRKISTSGTQTDYDISSIHSSSADILTCTSINIKDGNIYLAGIELQSSHGGYVITGRAYKIVRLSISALTASITSTSTTTIFGYSNPYPRVFGKPILDTANNMYFISNLSSFSSDSNRTNIYKVSSIGAYTILTDTLGSITAITIDSNNNLYAANRNSIYRITTGDTLYATFICSITQNTMTVTSMISGTISIGMRISTEAGFDITAQTSGTPGGAGTYTGTYINLYGNFYNDIVRTASTISTPVLFAGSATNASGYADGTGAVAYFNNITGMAFDLNNTLYVADAGNQLIRVITPDGVVKTIRQTGFLISLGTLIVDSSKNIYYVTGTKFNKLTIRSSYDLPFVAPLTNNIGSINNPSTTNGAEIFDFSLPSEPAYTIGNITNTTFQITSISADNATGFQYSLNSGALITLGAVPVTITSAAQSYNTLVLYSVNSIGKTQVPTYIQLAPPAPAITLGTTTSTGFSITFTPVLSPGSGSTYNTEYRYLVNGFNTTPWSISGTNPITATFTDYETGTAPSINIFAYYRSSGDTVFSASSNTLQIQLAPPAPVLSLVAGSTTDTGFQISWAPVTSPTTPGYTLSYLCKINGVAAPSGQVTIDTTVTPHKATFTGQAASTNMNVSVVAQYVGTGLPTIQTESASLNVQTVPNAPVIDANGYPELYDTRIQGILFDINFGSSQNHVNIYASYNVFYQYYLTYSDSTPAYTSGQYNLQLGNNYINISNIPANLFVNVQVRTILQSKTGTVTLTSPYSNTLSFQLNPPAPTGLAITGTTTSTGFSISFNAVNSPTGSPATTAYQYRINGTLVSSGISTTTSGSTVTATFSGQTAGAYLSVSVAAVFIYDGRNMISPATPISVQLAPAASIVLYLLSTATTGFSMQWAAASVPAGSPYTISYKWTLSTGLTGITTTTTAGFTGLPFNTTLTANVQVIYSLGITTMSSANSNTLSVTLLPVVTSSVFVSGFPGATTFTVQFYTAVPYTITGTSYSINGGTSYINIPSASYSYNSSTKIGTATITGQTAGSTIDFIFMFTYTQIIPTGFGVSTTIPVNFPYPPFNITLGSAAPTATLGFRTSTSFVVSLPEPTATISYTFKIGTQTLIPAESNTAAGETRYTFLNILPAGAYITLLTTQNALNGSGVITTTSDPASLAIQLLPPAPTNITLVTGTTTTTAFQMSWTAVTVSAGSPYTVSYTWTITNGTATQTGTPITTTSATITPTFTFNSPITFTVVTRYTPNGGGTTLTSVASTPLQIQNLPPTPSGLAITGLPTSTEFSASWTAIAAPGVSGYTTSYIWTLMPGNTTGTITATNRTFTGLIAGAFYNLSVYSKYDNTSSALTSAATAPINIQLAPVAPTGLAIVPNSIISTGFGVSWTAATLPVGSLSPAGIPFTLVSYDCRLGDGTTPPPSPQVTTLASGITATGGMVIDSGGNIYFADKDNHRIRKLAPDMTVSIIAGDGTPAYNNDPVGIYAKFNQPRGIALDPTGTYLYVADRANNCIRRIELSNTRVTTLAGRGVGTFIGSPTSFSQPEGIVVNSTGDIFVSDTGNNRICKVTPAGEVTTLAGSTYGFLDGIGTAAKFQSAGALAIDSTGNIFIADWHRIRKMRLNGSSQWVVSTIAGDGWNLYSSGRWVDGTGVGASFNYPSGIVVDASANIFVTDTSNNCIRKISLPSGNASWNDVQITATAGTGGVVTTFAGVVIGAVSQFIDGDATSATFNFPSGIMIDSVGNLYIGDISNAAIRKITRAFTSTTATFTGLTAGTTQTVTVRTVFTAGSYVLTSSPSTISVMLPATNPPLAPTGLALFGTPTVTTFTVSWNKVADPDSPYLTAYVFKANGTTVTPDSIRPFTAKFVGSISGTTLTVTSMILGTISTGMTMTEAAGTIGAQLTGTPGGTGTYTVTSQTVASTTITATTTVGRATFTAGASSYISAFSMYANYTDTAGTVIVSSTSSSSIPIQLAPSAPTGLAIVGTTTSNTFSVVWNKVIDPVPASGYSLSYEFKRDGISITPPGSISYTATTGTATFTGLAEGSFISTFNVHAKYTGAITLISTPSSPISVQLAPPIPTITVATSTTPTNTGFSIQWNNITVPASSPFTLSYSFSYTYATQQTGTIPSTSLQVGVATTVYPLTITSLPNGGTVTGMSIRAIYTSGSSSVSTQSNTLLVSIPGLPPVITSFTVTQSAIPVIFIGKPRWGEINYQWTLSGGTPTTYFFRTHGTQVNNGTQAYNERTAPHGTRDSSLNIYETSGSYYYQYEAPTPTYNSSHNNWQPGYFNPYIQVENSLGYRSSVAAPYFYRPGEINFTFAYNSGNLCNVYIQSCLFVNRYRLARTNGTVETDIRSVTHQQLLNTTDTLYTSTSPWRLLGTIPVSATTYILSVSNKDTGGDKKTIRITVSNITTSGSNTSCKMTIKFESTYTYQNLVSYTFGPSTNANVPNVIHTY